MVAKASTQKTSIERCYKLCGPVDPWIQSNSGKVCEHGYSLEWLCSFLKFFQVMEMLESMQLSCRDQFGTKVEFSAGYTKTHSLPLNFFPIDGKTITISENWEGQIVTNIAPNISQLIPACKAQCPFFIGSGTQCFVRAEISLFQNRFIAVKVCHL